MRKEKDKNRLLSKTIVNNTNCWNFTGFRDSEGYGKFWMNSYNRSIGAHRASYIIFIGEIPKGKVVCHRCDNTSCVNPSHLFVGEQKDNIKDKILKNRQAKGKTHKCYLYPELTLRGESNPNTKLSNKQVAEIRNLYASTNLTYRDLAAKYSISVSHVSNIVTNKMRT